MSRWFVLWELQTFLNVWQFRLEIRLRGRTRREKRSGPYAKNGPSNAADARFQNRVEMLRSFVLSELQPFLHIGQNRVEMRLGTPNPSRKTLWASRVEMQA
jgi:hypothetical protein